MRLRLALLAVCALFSAHAATYYVDPQKGADNNGGISETAPWQSLAKVNAAAFAPGDRILFKSGGRWRGQLAPKGSGAEGQPIVIDVYGGRDKAVIDGAGEVEDAVRLHNQDYWDIRNLEITNFGPKSSVRRGVHVVAQDYGTMRGIRLADLYVHDVNGDFKIKDNGGIVWRTAGPKPTRFDGLVIERCHVYRVDRSAIVAVSAFTDRRKWFPSLNVAIRFNTVDEIGGDGIVPWATDGAVVEYNVARRCNARADSYNAGIWPWSCDNTILRYNEAFLTQGTKDGQGFDSDYNSRNTVFEYNYSHDNEGGFMLICSNGETRPDRLGNEGTIVRYNISQNDDERSIHMPGPITKTRIHNNSIFVGKHLQVYLIQFSDWHGWAEDTEIADNLFVVDGIARYGHEARRFENGTFDVGEGFGPAKGTVFRGNQLVGNHRNPPENGKSSGKAGVAGSEIGSFDAEALRNATPMERHHAWIKFLANRGKAGAPQLSEY
jgi:hypothetical protein